MVLEVVEIVVEVEIEMLVIVIVVAALITTMIKLFTREKRPKGILSFLTELPQRFRLASRSAQTGLQGSPGRQAASRATKEAATKTQHARRPTRDHREDTQTSMQTATKNARDRHAGAYKARRFLALPSAGALWRPGRRAKGGGRRAVGRWGWRVAETARWVACHNLLH